MTIDETAILSTYTDIGLIV